MGLVSTGYTGMGDNGDKPPRAVRLDPQLGGCAVAAVMVLLCREVSQRVDKPLWNVAAWHVPVNGPSCVAGRRAARVRSWAGRLA